MDLLLDKVTGGRPPLDRVADGSDEVHIQHGRMVANLVKRLRKLFTEYRFLEKTQDKNVIALHKFAFKQLPVENELYMQAIKDTIPNTWYDKTATDGCFCSTAINIADVMYDQLGDKEN